MERAISFTLNGKPTRITVDDERMLLWVLPSDLGLTGAKYGCGAGLCGSCTVLVNKQAVRSCSVAVKEIAGKHLLTIEGLSKEGKQHPIQEAFVNHSAFQSGYCTCGMILQAYALLQKNSRPTRAEIVHALNDNLCRCGDYIRIVEAIQDAAAAMKGRAS